MAMCYGCVMMGLDCWCVARRASRGTSRRLDRCVCRRRTPPGRSRRPSVAVALPRSSVRDATPSNEPRPPPRATTAPRDDGGDDDDDEDDDMTLGR